MAREGGRAAIGVAGGREALHRRTGDRSRDTRGVGGRGRGPGEGRAAGRRDHRTRDAGGRWRFACECAAGGVGQVENTWPLSVAALATPRKVMLVPSDRFSVVLPPLETAVASAADAAVAP